MSSKQSDATIVRTFWKMFARDPNCPWVLRVYCVNNLALSTKMFDEMPPIPGTAKAPKGVSDPSLNTSKAAPTEAEAAAAVAVADVKNFMSQLNGGIDAQT
jgi:hypothetical protein